ncbi:Protein argonaute-4 [Orobanche hederae]
MDPSGAVPPPPPPPPVPKGVVPIKVAAPMEIKRLPMARRGLGTRGQKINLYTNHFNVKISSAVLDGFFYQYSVAITYEDGNPVEAKGVGRKILDKVQQTYESELDGKDFAYDGEKSLFTIGPLPQNKLEFDVVLGDDSFSRITTAGGGSPEGGGEGDKKRSRRQGRSSTYKVCISYATKIPLRAIAAALTGKESDNFQEAIRVLDIVLRQHAAKQGCLLVRQSFFHNQPTNFTPLGGGVVGCRGFHSSFRATQGGLSLNIDVSTTMIVQPGPVIDFLLANQNVKDPYHLDWVKAKKMLKNLRITTRPSSQERKIVGLSDRICRDQTFALNKRSDDPDAQPVELTVYDYFVNHRKIPLQYSGDFPCINVGKPKRPTYFPIELCELVSLQRYTKSLTNLQRASLVEKSRQKPLERMKTLTNALSVSNYNADRLLASSGISISNQFTPVEGRVLSASKLKVGNGEEMFPRNGKWNFNRKKLIEPVALERWAIVNFSARCNIEQLRRELIQCGRMKGIAVSDPFETFDESPQFRRSPAPVRVEKMFEEIMRRLPGPPQLLLCILPERKNSDIYGRLTTYYPSNLYS